MNKAINLIFPHQLFKESVLIDNDLDCYLVEEYLFFKQYRFHKQKIAFHRASMKYYQGYLEGLGKKVHYIETTNPRADIRKFQSEINTQGITAIHCIDPTDNWLEKRIKNLKVSSLKMYENPQFLNAKKELSPFFNPDKKKFFQTSFYKEQRKKRNILLDEAKQPIGGKWTYDLENRKKYPKNKPAPLIQFPKQSILWDEAVEYTNKHFKNNLGSLSKLPYYPITHQEAKDWLEQFLIHRFFDFGSYEDAIVKEYTILNHSVLSPLINAGLIMPSEVLETSLTFAAKENIPINSTEGFVRQIIGWREFIRGMYECKGSFSRTSNFWGFHRKIPASFYEGTTGIDPVDQTIQKVLKTGYCHHIERLMILGNFMLLCEFHPDEVYQWFMELFIDAYDWVMVPNIYGMSQFADGGTFATKPYIGGANYIKKMSNYRKGKWEEVWNGLFWHFIDKHKSFFMSNPRLSMMAHLHNKMDQTKKEHHHLQALNFLEKLH